MARTAGFEPTPQIGSMLSSLGDWCATVTLCPHLKVYCILKWLFFKRKFDLFLIFYRYATLGNNIRLFVHIQRETIPKDID